jgi:GNAT superfamily N-acetyltransferase
MSGAPVPARSVLRGAGRADVPELAGLMRGFYAESGFVLDEERARAGFAALLADARLGRIWLIERDAPKAGAGAAVGYIVVTFVFAMEYGGMAATVDDFFVRPEARGEGLGKAALAEVRRACEGLGTRALRVEVGLDNPVARAVYRSAGFESLSDRGVMAAPLAPPTHKE